MRCTHGPAHDSVTAASADRRSHRSASDASGRRYLADVLGHRIVVEEPDGRCWTFGEAGRGAGELRHPRGLAVLQGSTAAETRIFVCDCLNHRVQVFDGDGMPRLAFGRCGERPGQFAGPADIALVYPRLPGDEWWDAVDEPLLAVADQLNGRVQVLRLDGTVVAVIGALPGEEPALDVPPETGWPFFRLAPDPALHLPARLSWEDPHLVVTCSHDRVVRFDLALAMLPAYALWRREAGTWERARARRYHALLGRRERALPSEVLTELAPDTVAA